MPLDPQDMERLAILAARAAEWPMVRKVPIDQQLDVVQNALAEAYKSGCYDAGRGPIEGWFKTIVRRSVAQHFDQQARRKEETRERIEDEVLAVDAGMDRLELLECESEIAMAAAEAFRSSSDRVKEVVAGVSEAVKEIPCGGLNDLDRERIVATIAARLGISEGATKTRLSRFAREFAGRMGRKQSGDRVNVFVVIQVTERSTCRMNVRGVFMTGDVSNSVVANGDVKGIDVHFEQFASDVKRIASAVEANRDIPSHVKGEVLEYLDDLETEARSDVPALDVILGTAQRLASVFPGIIKIARSVGVAFFG